MKHLYTLTMALAITANAFAYGPAPVMDFLPADNDPEIITEPQGAITYYDRVAYGWYIYAGGMNLQYGKIPGASKIVWGDNDEVYIQDPLTANMTGAYIKCHNDGQKLTAQFPQVIALLPNGYDEIPLYIGKMEVCGNGQNDPGDLSEGYSYRPVSTDDSITWTINPDGTITMDGEDVALDKNDKFVDPVNPPRYIMGTYYYLTDDQTGETYDVWNAVGDWAQTYTPVETRQITTIPEGLESESWQMATDATFRMVNVAIDGDDFYIADFTQYAPQAAIIGKIEGDKVSFPTGQFLGFNERGNSAMWFLSAMAVYDVWDFGDTQMTILDHFDRTDALVFDYDSENKTMVTEKNACFIINASLGEISFYEYQVNPSLTMLSDEGTNAAPANPTFLECADFGADGYYYDWDIPSTNVNGVQLNTNEMYYNVYLNGELYTFYPDTYDRIKTEMTNIPYNFTDDWDFDVRGALHGIYFHAEGIENVGMIVYYRGSDGVLYHSDLINSHWPSGINDTLLPSEAMGEAYYDLSGRLVNNPGRGIYIKSVKYSDGSISNSKIAIYE